jgi:tetratricopeptide (TPR) repeat protein
MKIRGEDKGFAFPYLYDGETQAMSLAYGPKATPHVFVFDRERTLRFVGRIDDNENPAKATTTDTRDAIEALLADGRSAEALAICERLAADPGDRGMSRYLSQYGRALAYEGRPRDAAVMFLRCAILYDGSRHAASSLIDAAIIHRDVFDDPAAARRLLKRAVTIADAQGDADALRRARELLPQLLESSAP